MMPFTRKAEVVHKAALLNVVERHAVGTRGLKGVRAR